MQRAALLLLRNVLRHAGGRPAAGAAGSWRSLTTNRELQLPRARFRCCSRGDGRDRPLWRRCHATSPGPCKPTPPHIAPAPSPPQRPARTRTGRSPASARACASFCWWRCRRLASPSSPTASCTPTRTRTGPRRRPSSSRARSRRARRSSTGRARTRRGQGGLLGGGGMLPGGSGQAAARPAAPAALPRSQPAQHAGQPRAPAWRSAAL
jgi:hypothetical protein